MTRFALFGFFVGLLAGRLGSQTVLFTVSANPDARTVTIAAAPSASILIPQTFPNSLDASPNYGFTLINLFTYTYNPGSSVDIQQNTLSVTDGNGTPQLLVGQQSLGQINTREQGFTNDGINFDFFTLETPPLSLSRGTTITFSGSLTFSNLSAFTQASFDSSYPYRVYGGQNNAYDGASFLGTYTISVVPEPSTYAAIAGGLGLAAAVIHRRRQRAKAAQA